MHEHDSHPIQEILWRRPLTREEAARLRGGASLDFKPATEAALTRALTELPNADVPSNFTARVLAETDRLERLHDRSAPVAWWRRFVPRLAVGGGLAVAVLLGVSRYEAHRQLETARQAVELADVAAPPTVEILQDFEAIERMSQTPAQADLHLLAALQ